MDNRSEDEVLGEPEKARLLERASQLDAAHSSGAEIRELRAAALEAGISAAAFDTALAELREPAKPSVMTGSNRRARMLTAGVAAVALIMLGVVMNRDNSASAARGPMLDQTISLRCISPSEAAELIRPTLNLRANQMRISADAPHTINVRVTPEQSRRIKALLDERESGAAACLTPQKP